MALRGASRVHTLYLKICYRFCHMGKDVSIDPSCDIRAGAAPYIDLGDAVRLDKGVWLNVPSEAGPPVPGHPHIQIGDRTFIGRRCMLTALERIQIENDVMFGPGVLVADHSHEFCDRAKPIMQQGVTKPGRVIIEEGCWLGFHSVVVTHQGRDVRIGRNSVIGANAVVTKSFPAYSVLVGNPARNVRKPTGGSTKCG